MSFFIFSESLVRIKLVFTLLLLQKGSRQRSQLYRTLFTILPETLKPFFAILDVKLQTNMLLSSGISILSRFLTFISKSLFLDPANKSERNTIIQP